MPVLPQLGHIKFVQVCCPFVFEDTCEPRLNFCIRYTVYGIQGG